MTTARRRILLRTLAIVVGGVILLSMLGFGLFRSDPRWYHRVKLTEAQQAAGQQRLLDSIATLRNQVGRTQATMPATTKPAWPPFDLQLSEDDVNGVIMRWADTEPDLKIALRHIKEPHVRFLNDRIEFAGRSDALGTIVSIELTVKQTDEGPRISLGRPWAGRLPLSRSFLEEPGEEGVNALRASSKSHVPPAFVDALGKLIAGDEVVPMVPVPSSLQGQGLLSARIEKLSIADGKLKATLRPE